MWSMDDGVVPWMMVWYNGLWCGTMDDGVVQWMMVWSMDDGVVNG